MSGPATAEPEGSQAEQDSAAARPEERAASPEARSADRATSTAATKDDEPALVREWRKLTPFLSLLDFGGRPASHVAWVVRVLAMAIAVTFLVRRIGSVTTPLLSVRSAPAIPTEEIEDYRFRLPERTRREIFAELATAELAERARAIAANTWSGHIWSREDDRGHQERVAVRALAAKYKVSLAQVYLVLDEGLREHWLGPDGKPLRATTPPLDIRSNSW